MIGGAAIPPIPPESCDHVTLMPSRPSQPIVPDAVFPAPWTNAHGGLPASKQTLSPAVYCNEQSVVGVTPSASNTVPPHVLAWTPRTQKHESCGPSPEICTCSALITNGTVPPRSLPTVSVSFDGTHMPFGQS